MLPVQLNFSFICKFRKTFEKSQGNDHRGILSQRPKPISSTHAYRIDNTERHALRVGVNTARLRRCYYLVNQIAYDARVVLAYGESVQVCVQVVTIDLCKRSSCGNEPKLMHTCICWQPCTPNVLSRVHSSNVFRQILTMPCKMLARENCTLVK